MPCDTKRRANQSLDQRKTEVREAIASLSTLLASGRVKTVIDQRTGAVAFSGWTAGETARVTDACGYRLVMAAGSALAKQAIQRAEILAGRTVNRAALTAGIHSHNGGASFHHGH